MSKEEAPNNRPPGVLAARIRFSPQVREVLVAIIKRVQTAKATAPEDFAVPQGPTEVPDTDLHAAWAEGLRERFAQDNQVLFDLINHEQFGRADLPLTPVAAEAVMRACTSVRLYLRETLLRKLTQAEAERGEHIFRLPPAEQQGYACFRLLGYLEEDLLYQIDPGLLYS